MKSNTISRAALLAIGSIALLAIGSGSSRGASPAADAATKTDSTAADAPSSANPERIVIVSSLPRTGSARQQTDSIVNGVRMALDEVDSRVGDFRIEYRDLDDATASAGNWTPEQESSNAISASRDPDVMVYIGPFNS